MSPQDELLGPQPGTFSGVKFYIKNGAFRVLTAGSWGVEERNPTTCWNEVFGLYSQAKSCGLPARTSAASTAIQTYLERFDGKDGHPSLRQLPSRWRGIAHSSLHGGPIVVTRGGAEDAVQIDINKAYLAALREPMPILGVEDDHKVGGWFTTDDRRWSTIRKLYGFVDASIRVLGPTDPEGIPPLPIHDWSGAIYARGYLRGSWTIASVREAEDRGELEVLAVHAFAFAPTTRPIFAPLGELFETLPPVLSKRLYTRFWGRLGMRGGYIAHTSDKPVEGAVPCSGLWWNWNGVDLTSYEAGRTYRPDLAASIASFNHRRVIAATRSFAPGSVIALHVDSIWTDDFAGAARMTRKTGLGSWREKRRGPLRFYGVGCYEHDGHLAASGYDATKNGTLTRERVLDWLQVENPAHRRSLVKSRVWTGDPAVDMAARSRPFNLVLDLQTNPVPGWKIDDEKCWTLGGWARPETNEAAVPETP